MAGHDYVQNNHNWNKLSEKLLIEFNNLINTKTGNK